MVRRAVGVCCAVAALWCVRCIGRRQLNQLFRYDRTDSPVPPDEGLGRALHLRHPNGERLVMRYTEGTGTDGKKPVLLLYSHGKAGDLDCKTIRQRFELMASSGASVLAYDYRGYGRSDGTASEQNVIEDLEAVFRYAENTLQYPRNRIVMVGQSLGTGPTIDLATRTTGLHTIVLVHPYRSITRVVLGDAAGLLRLIGIDMFVNEEKVAGVMAERVVVVHGTADNLVNFSHGQHLVRLMQTAGVNCELVPVEGAGHAIMFATHQEEMKSVFASAVNGVR